MREVPGFTAPGARPPVADESLAPELRCYCGWWKLGQCPHCPSDRTAADRARDRGNDARSSVCRCNDMR